MSRADSRFLLLALGVALAVAAVVALSRTRSHPELTVQGRTVSSLALDALRSPSAGTRDDAAAKLQALGPAAVPDLIRLLRTPDPFMARPVRRVALWLPAKAAAKLNGIVQPLEGSSKRAAAAHALRNLGPSASEAIPALQRALHDDLTVSWYAALALAQMGPPGLAALNQELMSVPSIQCGYVCYALGTEGQLASNAIPSLVLLLEKNNPVVSDKAATALSNMGRLAVPGLLQALASPQSRVRAVAMDALGHIGPLARQALPRLVAIAKEDEPKLREAAVGALGQVGPTTPAVVEALAQALKDPIREVRLKALESLGRSPATASAAVPAVVAALADPSPDIRGQAATLLGEMGSRPDLVTPALERASTDENESVRAKARDALQRVKVSR